MTWQQHSIVQIDNLGIPCHFTTRSAGSEAQVIGWIMPDGVGVFQDQGIRIEFEPGSIITDNLDGLRLARQGAAERHFNRFIHDYQITDDGKWIADGEKWFKRSGASIAAVPGTLSIHVTFKAGAAELLRFYTEFQSEAHEKANSQPYRQGVVGIKLAEGEVVLTSSGRLTTPFPKLGFDSDRKASNTLKRVDQWLMENALAEAEARGDGFNTLQFRACLTTPQQCDKDSAEEYLFGNQPSIATCPLSMLGSLTASA